MNKASIKLKLQLIVLTSVVVTAISLMIVSSISLNILSEDSVEIYRTDIMQSKIDNIKDATRFATQTVESYYNNIHKYRNDFLKEKIELLLNELNNAYKKNKTRICSCC